MRIGFDAFPTLSSFGGVGNYARSLLRALLELQSGDEFVGYIPKGPGGPKDRGERELFPQLRWREVGKPWFGQCGWLDALDLYHGTNFKVQTRGRYGTIVTIHDLWLDRYPEHSKKFFGQHWSSLRTRRQARLADRVITISHHSAQDIQEIFGIPSERISVILNGVSSDFWPDQSTTGFSTLRAQYGIPQAPYVLFVGGADPRKNHRTLFQAYANLPSLRRTHYLVVIGNPIHRSGTVRGTCQELGIEDRVIVTGSVPLAHIRLLYSHADLFVFPSLYEGFGFPVLEAMACGAPVITSNSTALPEVAGDAAILVNPENEGELGSAMFRALEDPALQMTLRTRGFERAKQFSWEKAARQTLEVYREVSR